ncbi:UNVERIFIED_CONTAM: putative disease resistance RPP8-like protein 2 [Sesamum latifolium]|uniref:Disease resistance RPP8-like protein 2 n=1 Tax=Sesamum latifolium TaxID=2727402 RepID=A0AAW2UEG8_9LAMI
MEEVAKEYLIELIDRNLILVRKLDFRGNIDTCEIHDLLRDLCMRESEKEQYFLVRKAQFANFQMENVGGFCFLCGHGSTFQMINFPKVQIASRSALVSSALVCNNCRDMHPHLARLRLVRMKYFIGSYTVERLHPTNLRLLLVKSGTSSELLLPSKMSFLWDLRCLHIYEATVLPIEIWDMAQLRYLIVESAILPDPIVTADFIVLENLHTLCTIRNFKYAKDLPLKNISFPTSLKELRLTRCKISWEEMTIIGSSLPTLETLILRNNAFKGYEWDTVEGQFLHLKVLLIYKSDLVWWRAENSHFPNLKTLFLQRMYLLKEIPLSIGDIATLGLIYLRDCGDSVVNSAKQILEEQDGLGNETLEIYVDGKQLRS